MRPNIPVEVIGLSKSYGNQQVLKNISFKVDRGSLVSLVGPNGTGKSTLLKLLLRIEMPSQGDALLFGNSIHQDHAQFNELVGYVSESVEYTLPMPMGEIPKLMSKLHPRWSNEIFGEISSMLDIPLQRKFREVSRGQKMQFAFAVACASQPRLLILDEITAVFDPSVRLQVMRYLKGLANSGGTVLLATNILTEVQSFTDRLMIIDAGSIVFDERVSNFPQRFVKLRTIEPNPKGIFEHPECKEVGVNSDRSISYILPMSHSKSNLHPSDLDRRAITPEDLFIYFTRKVG